MVALLGFLPDTHWTAGAPRRRSFFFPRMTSSKTFSRASGPDFSALIDGVSRTFPVRVVTLEGNPWFALPDVRSVLGIVKGGTNTAFLADDETRLLRRCGQTTPVEFWKGTASSVALVSESGLYRLIMRSDKPQARPFQDWVTREVLPSIRKTGSYELPKGEVMPLPADFADAMEQHARTLIELARVTREQARTEAERAAAEAAKKQAERPPSPTPGPPSRSRRRSRAAMRP